MESQQTFEDNQVNENLEEFQKLIEFCQKGNPIDEEKRNGQTQTFAISSSNLKKTELPGEERPEVQKVPR